MLYRLIQAGDEKLMHDIKEKECIIFSIPNVGQAHFNMEEGRRLSGENIATILENVKIGIVEAHIKAYGIDRFDRLPTHLFGETTIAVIHRAFEKHHKIVADVIIEEEKTASRKKQAARAEKKKLDEAKKRVDRLFREQQVAKSKKGH